MNNWRKGFDVRYRHYIYIYIYNVGNIIRLKTITSTATVKNFEIISDNLNKLNNLYLSNNLIYYNIIYNASISNEDSRAQQKGCRAIDE
jgi:hypothetical protein